MNAEPLTSIRNLDSAAASNLAVLSARELPTSENVKARRAETVRAVVGQGLIDDDHPLCAVIDLDTLDELIASLRAAYPDSIRTLHTVAAKAIALPAVLRYVAQAGLGCEVASPGELRLALEAGFPPERIIFDSPAKTMSDISTSLRLGVSFNIDNFEELERVDGLIAELSGHGETAKASLPRIGVRVNPQSGAGAIEAMSTATPTSKFGIGLSDFRDRLVEAFVERPWLRQLHVHSGSQGVGLGQAASDIAAVVDLAESVEQAVGHQQVEVIDVGGGLSVNFGDDSTSPGFDEHASALQKAAPGLFSGKYDLVTEFGRSLTAKTGLLLGRVEYVKRAGLRSIAVTHIGVQVATRTVFMPDAWPLRIEVYAPDGTPRHGRPQVYDVAGPACFAGDLIATNRTLPEIEAGDLVAVPDTGGYYMSNHFGYNSLTRPAVYATRTTHGGTRRDLLLVRRAQTLDELLAESGEPALVSLTAPRGVPDTGRAHP